MTIQERLDAIPDLRLAVFGAGLDFPNLKLLENKIIKEDDDALMTQLEDGYAAYLAEETVRYNKLEVETIGQTVRDACDRALNIVIGTNVKTGKSRADRDQMRTSFANVLEELKSYELSESIRLIKLLPTDAFYITDDLKDHVLEILEGALP